MAPGKSAEGEGRQDLRRGIPFSVGQTTPNIGGESSCRQREVGISGKWNPGVGDSGSCKVRYSGNKRLLQLVPFGRLECGLGGRVRWEKGQKGWTLSSTVPTENPVRPLSPGSESRRGKLSPYGQGGWSSQVQCEVTLFFPWRSIFRCLQHPGAGRSQRVALHELECVQSDQGFQGNVVDGSVREFPVLVAA